MTESRAFSAALTLSSGAATAFLGQLSVGSQRPTSPRSVLIVGASPSRPPGRSPDWICAGAVEQRKGLSRACGTEH